jgi:hypothetical protein
MSSSRKLKTKRKVDLRQKNLGLVTGSIDTSGQANERDKPNKILFGDDYDASDVVSDKQGCQEEILQPVSDAIIEEDSDDEVEHISSSTAKKQAIEMFAAERKTRKEEKAFTSKRKRKTKEPSESHNKPIEDDEDHQVLNDEFFSILDEERKNKSKAKKMKNQNLITHPVGRHTTFVSDIDDSNRKGSILDPMSVGHDVQVVVLPDLSSEVETQDNRKALREKYLESLSASLGTKPSETALLYCRGSQSLDMKGREKGFQIKRSRRMKYSLTRGHPSSAFKVRKHT